LSILDRARLLAARRELEILSRKRGDAVTVTGPGFAGAQGFARSRRVACPVMMPLKIAM
jgi:hypothetical protein